MDKDIIYKREAIEAIKRAIWDKQTAKDAIDAVCNIPSTQSEQAIKDCRNCKHGRYNDYWDTYFCYCPNDCNDWDKWEPSTQPEQSSEIQDILNYLDTVLHPIISPEHWNVYSELYDMISMLPSAQLEQQWTPCSERPPEEESEVLVTTSWNDVCKAWYSNGKWRAEFINEYDDDEILA